MRRSIYLRLISATAILIPLFACVLAIVPDSRAAFGTDPLLFISERGDLHLNPARAHSSFFKVIQGDSYFYGMRTKSEDTLFSAEEFYKHIDDRRKESPKAPIVIFVHGCCVSFGEQLLQANDLEKAIDKAFARSPDTAAGRPITFSYDWAAPFSYASSLENCYAAQNRFDTFMEKLVNRYGANNIIIVAHSLGTLMVQNYANQIKDQDSVVPFQTIVFSRADVDRDSFAACLQALKVHSGRLVVLSANNDPNIYASSLLRKLGVKFAQAAVLPTKLPLPLPKKKNSSAAGTGGSQPETPSARTNSPSTSSTSDSTASGSSPSSAAATSSPSAKDAAKEAHKSSTRRLGQVKVAREFSSNVEVYDVSSLRIGHGIPYRFIADMLFHNAEDFDLKKSATGLVTVRSARP